MHVAGTGCWISGEEQQASGVLVASIFQEDFLVSFGYHTLVTRVLDEPKVHTCWYHSHSCCGCGDCLNLEWQVCALG